MVTSLHYSDIPTTGGIDRIPANSVRESQPDGQIAFMLNRKSEEKNKTGDYATITLDQAARLLNISTATTRLWSNMGLLQTSISPSKGKTVRLADILTFLPEENRAVSFMERMNNNPAKAGSMRRKRQKLAEVNVRAITRLTKQSVLKISHLGGRPMVRIGK